MINVYSPELQVWLHKTIMRQTTNGKDAVSARFQGSAARQRIDLKPFLGQGSHVHVSKSVSQPAGAFSIVLIDKPDMVDGDFESLYGLIEPMDMIEIRMRHGAPKGTTRAPIVMRGFVSEVMREESSQPGDGRPTRSVIVNGQDYGKLWQIIQISFLANYIVGQAYISGFPLFEQYQISNNVMTAAEFANDVLTKIINDYLAKLIPENATLPSVIQPDITVGPCTVSPGLQTHEGTIYNMLRYYGDVGAWNELFIEDREDGVFMVYRPNPYLNTDGSDTKIQEDAPEPVYVDISARDLSSLRLSRSDADVANFYWVQAPRFNLAYDTQRRQEATASGQTDIVLAEYANSATKFYGIRIMLLETQQGGQDMGTQNTGRPAADYDRLGAAATKWMDKRRDVVVRSNRDNIVLERGSMVLRGNEEVRAGTYIRLRRGNLVSIYYVSSVDHHFTPFEGFTTVAQVERGTGFIERVKSSGSPYFEEKT